MPPIVSIDLMENEEQKILMNQNNPKSVLKSDQLVNKNVEK